MTDQPYIHVKSMNFPLYPGKFVIVLSNDPGKVNQLVEFEDEQVYAHSIRDKFKGHKGYYCILNFNNVVPVTHGTIAHEAAHIAWFLMEHVGIELDFFNPEPFNYLLHWITDQIHKFSKSKGFEPL